MGVGHPHPNWDPGDFKTIQDALNVGVTFPFSQPLTLTVPTNPCDPMTLTLTLTPTPTLKPSFNPQTGL